MKMIENWFIKSESANITIIVKPQVEKDQISLCMNLLSETQLNERFELDSMFHCDVYDVMKKKLVL